MQIRYNSAQSNAVRVAVTTAVLQILGVFNADNTPNSSTNPAQAGSVMTLYLAGVGQTNPPSQDGQVNTAPLPAPPSSIQIEGFATGYGNVVLPVTFAGAAPGAAAGIFQVNFVAPQSLTNVFLIVGQNSTQFNIWAQ
jgi:uncharacterized protein (TIGR03437 family)